MPRPVLQRYPVVDGYVLTNSVAETITAGDTPEVPILIGYTAREGLAFARDRKNLEKIMHRALGEKADGYLSLCPQDGPEFEQYKTDMATELLQSAAQALALTREQQQKGETYVYCLDRNLPGDDKGPFHAADLWYVFRTLLRSWRPWEAEDHMLAYACNTYWANFAKYGTPNGDRKPELPAWTPYTAEHPQTMRLGDTCEMIVRESNARVQRRQEDIM